MGDELEDLKRARLRIANLIANGNLAIQTRQAMQDALDSLDRDIVAFLRRLASVL